MQSEVVSIQLCIFFWVVLKWDLLCVCEMISQSLIEVLE